MRIAHVSTYDVTGGAARAAYRLHGGLRALGQDSRMCVRHKVSSDSSVLQFEPSRDYASRVRQAVLSRFLHRNRKPVFSMSPYFSNDRGENTKEIIRQIPPTDILHLHWVARFVDSGDFFRCVARGLPIVWTLHDMNPFTAGCHFDGGCGKYLTRCGSCPQLEALNVRDYSSQAWQRKRDAYTSLNSHAVHVVAPSQWLAKEARESALLSGFPVAVIPYGVDTESFQPREQEFARRIFKIPLDAKVVLFVADWASEKRKGMEFLLKAIEGLQNVPNLFLLAVGKGISAESLGPSSAVIDNVSDEVTLSLIYSCADLFVVPSIQDNFPNTALEALACGTPTIAFSVGGLPDIVRDGQTGALVPSGDVRSLGETIRDLLANVARRKSMAAECRRVALQEYQLDVQARRYLALYQNTLDKLHAALPH